MTCSTRFYLPVLALMLMACPSLAQDRTLIVPGKSVGMIEAATTEADLVDRLPVGEVKRVLYSLGEGAAGCGTEVFSGTPDVVTIGWSNVDVEYELDNAVDLATCRGLQGLAGPASVTIENPAGAWHTADGIKIGMTISELARLVGEPVSVSVCPCDFGGFIDAPWQQFGERLQVWAEYPVNSDDTYAAIIDTMADYMLSSTDIGAEAENDFWLSRMIVTIGDGG